MGLKPTILQYKVSGDLGTAEIAMRKEREDRAAQTCMWSITVLVNDTDAGSVSKHIHSVTLPSWLDQLTVLASGMAVLRAAEVDFLDFYQDQPSTYLGIDAVSDGRAGSRRKREREKQKSKEDLIREEGYEVILAKNLKPGQEFWRDDTHYRCIDINPQGSRYWKIGVYTFELGTNTSLVLGSTFKLKVRAKESQSA